MTIHLPKDVEQAITAAVHRGDFASVDDAVTTAWRAFEQSRTRQSSKKAATLDELNQRLLVPGLITQLPNPAADIDDDPHGRPIAIEGEPLSASIIRERR